MKEAATPCPATRAKKQNHANIPCPIENCARFTYGKLPDHLTKRHGLKGEERDRVNECQRKRFFNGELCQVRFLKEAAIKELWGEDYNDPKIVKKIHDSYAMVKIRIIPITATTNRVFPLTEQDANVLTNYNARTVEKVPKVTKKKRKTVEDEDGAESSSDNSLTQSPKRRKSCESSDGEENNSQPTQTCTERITPISVTEQAVIEIADDSSGNESSGIDTASPSETDNTNYTYEIIDGRTTPSIMDRVHDIFDSKIDDKYKSVINDMKKSMIMGRTLSSKKQRTYRNYKRYAKRLISYLHRQHSIVEDIDVMLCNEEHVCTFIQKVHHSFKPKTVRNYIIACIKLLDSRLFVIETDAACKDKVAQMTAVYNKLHKYLMECLKLLPKKIRETNTEACNNQDFNRTNTSPEVQQSDHREKLYE